MANSDRRPGQPWKSLSTLSGAGRLARRPKLFLVGQGAWAGFLVRLGKISFSSLNGTPCISEIVRAGQKRYCVAVSPLVHNRILLLSDAGRVAFKVGECSSPLGRSLGYLPYCLCTLAIIQTIGSRRVARSLAVPHFRTPFILPPCPITPNAVSISGPTPGARASMVRRVAHDWLHAVTAT